MSSYTHEERELLHIRDDARRIVRGEIERGRGRHADEKRLDVGANDRPGGKWCENGETIGVVQRWEDVIGGIVFKRYRRIRRDGRRGG